MSLESKRCGTCGEVKQIEAFSKNRVTKDGLQKACKTCVHIRNVSYYTAHREQIVSRTREYCVANLDKRKQIVHRHNISHRQQIANAQRKYNEANREMISAKQREYRAANRDRLAEQNRQYNILHSKAILERKRAYRRANPERFKVYTQRRRTQKHQLPDTLTAADWQRCLDYWQDSCAICGRVASNSLSIAADHWIPLSDPDPANPGTCAGNILPLCHGTGGCNNSKKNHEPVNWLFKRLGSQAGKAKLAQINAYFAWVSG